jgi:hypothetical protein
LARSCFFHRDTSSARRRTKIAIDSKVETDQRIATLRGKIIGITGIIELHQGKPEIKAVSGIEDLRSSSVMAYFATILITRKVST